MIAAAIFIAHVAAAVYAFIKYKKDGLGEGFLAIGFMIVIFSVGWTLSTMIAKVIFPAELIANWIGKMEPSLFSRVLAKETTTDTFSLVLLTIGEAAFYNFYLPSKGAAKKRGEEEV